MIYFEKDLSFYDIMNYPIPKQKDFFVYWKQLAISEKINTESFSWETKNEFLDEFLTIINKHWKLYKSLPFISEIFLCNSITFNALHSDSDIDLFIVAKKDSLWRARFFSALFFKLLWLKRTLGRKAKKYCLSFYVTDDNKNLYPVLLPNKTDIYLAYWLAHLVPLYQEDMSTKNIYEFNPWFKSYLPNHPLEYYINIWVDNFSWSTKFKKIFEFIFWWFVWKITENFIKIIWLPILKNKVKKLWIKWKQIIINDKILKFHDDIREYVSDQHYNIIN